MSGPDTLSGGPSTSGDGDGDGTGQGSTDSGSPDPSGGDSGGSGASGGTTGSDPTGGSDGGTSDGSGGATSTDPTGSDTSPGTGDTGGSGDMVFEEVDGIVSFEAEHYFLQDNNDPTAIYWYTFEDGAPDPMVECVTNVECTANNKPNCNQYPDCDGDAVDPGEAAGGAYVEPLPDRRRDDKEPQTGNLGVVNNQSQAAALHYRVVIEEPGRYYVWARARGQGPAANGLHVGIDGTWPENDLIDPSSMRLQFPGGWGWTQNRRGGSQHTGVSGTDQVSRRDANVWLQIDSPGEHIITLAMREDGLELDKIVLARDPDFEPTGDGPPETTAP